jgi:hypothetical protein
MLAGKTSQKAGNLREFVAWNGVRNDEDAVVRVPVIEKLYGKLDEVIPVSSYKASLFPGGTL